MSIELIVMAIIALWLLIGSIYVFNLYRIINGLTKESKDEGFIKVLDKVLKTEKQNKVRIKDLQKSLENTNLKSIKHVQKVGLIRFNPFDELGGDHSFALALLNDEDSGVVITGLHTRERTRVYAKEVINGKTKNEVSNEESKALKKALKS